MLKLFLIAAAAAATVFAAPAGASGAGITRHDQDVIRFFQHHPKLARTAAGGAALASVLPHVVADLRSIQSAATEASSPLSLSGRWPGPPWPQPPAWFLPDIACIERGESHDGHDPNANGNLFGMLDGWGQAGGSYPVGGHSYHEQLYRAWVLYNWASEPAQGGNGWSPWTTAPGCGLD
jgi:hypothetical protein